MTAVPFIFFNDNQNQAYIGYGKLDECVASADSELQLIDDFIDNHPGQFIAYYLSYELKNKIYPIDSKNIASFSIPDFHFWIPEIVYRIEKETLIQIQGDKNDEIYHNALHFLSLKNEEHPPIPFEIQQRIDKTEYIKQVNYLKEEIQLGNCYEINFCQEFYAENVVIPSPNQFYWKLNQLTEAPYSAYINFNDMSIFCGSPELFIKKINNKLYSSPIKGTAKRGNTPEDDLAISNALKQNTKERAENIMIVDLVRNDLSKIALKNSVHVDELCEIYSFKTVHQMISTISCELAEETSFASILKALFPMGSMTGAPKLSAMELIEKTEAFKRGLYSGSIGYILPNGDFSSNVVIRSVLHDKTTGYLSCAVGSAITKMAEAESEYEECLIKVQRILDGLRK